MQGIAHAKRGNAQVHHFVAAVEMYIGIVFTDINGDILSN